MIHLPNRSALSRWPLIFGGLLIVALFALNALANSTVWKLQWPKTDFSKQSIDLGEIMSGGPPKDGISAIDKPEFITVAHMVKAKNLADGEPVVGVEINREAKAYPLRFLIWHEIVNDEVGGMPVTVIYRTLCNSATVFEQRLDVRVFDFGTTGNLRKSDLVIYDRQTESWWQQFLGEGIVDEMTGKCLTEAAQVESFARFQARAPNGKVLIKLDGFSRSDGMNSYGGYDSKPVPFL